LVSSVPEWRLPRGVSRGMWDYARTDHIANDYDEYFAYNQLFAFDESVLLDEFRHPGAIVDLGCGTGRLLVAFARRGFRGVAVDLSHPMLQIVGKKADSESLPIDRVQANLVDLDCLADASCDYCVIMFNTLGMIRGLDNRLRVLRHARRILRPGGRFALHVHNRWQNLFDPQGRWWLLGSLLGRGRSRGLEPGDKVFEYRGIPNVQLHLFSLGEMRRLLRRSGFRIARVIPLDAERQRPLARPWALGRIRANGWIVIAD